MKHSNPAEKGGQDSEKPRGSKRSLRWALRISLLTFILAACIAVCADLLTAGASVWVVLLILVLLIGIGCTFDMVGTAMASADPAPFVSMSSRKIRGARESVMLLQNAEKVSSICCDVIGDICGIVSGSASVALVAFLAMKDSTLPEVLCSAFVSALTVGSKALGKTFAMNRAKDIVFLVGRLFSFFKKQEKK